MPLIATLTLNPAMDLSVSTARVTDTQLRCSAPRHDPGGGGINVARVVKTLGGKAVAVYLAGAVRRSAAAVARRTRTGASPRAHRRRYAGEFHRR